MGTDLGEDWTVDSHSDSLVYFGDRGRFLRFVCYANISVLREFTYDFIVFFSLFAVDIKGNLLPTRYIATQTEYRPLPISCGRI